MPFTRHETQVAKGVAVIFMVYHHLFFSDSFSAPYGVTFAPFSPERGYQWAQLAKVCVFVFVFLSGYGMARATQKLRAVPPAQPGVRPLARYMGARTVHVMAGYLFVFVLAAALAYLCKGAPRGLPNPDGVYGTGFYGFCYLLVDALGLSFISGNPTLNPEWWYVSIALLVIFSMPLFLRWHEKSGVISWLCCLVLSFWLYTLGGEGVGHLMLLPLGIAFAENNWFERLRACAPVKGRHAPARVGSALVRLAAAGVWFLFFLRLSLLQNGFYFSQQLAAPALVYLAYEGLAGLPFLGRAVGFVGRHSMNIYFTHTLLMRSFVDVLFSLRSAWLITLALLAASLLLSVALEWLKRLLRYDKLTQRLANRVLTPARPTAADGAG